MDAAPTPEPSSRATSTLPQIALAVAVIGFGLYEAVQGGGFQLLSRSTLIICVGLSFLPWPPIGLLGGVGILALGINDLVRGHLYGVLVTAVGAYAVYSHLAPMVARRRAE